MSKTTTLWLERLGLGTALLCHCFTMATAGNSILARGPAGGSAHNLIVPGHALTIAPQPITVKGRITDDKGEPLPGVGVQVKGTAVGTSTNAEGNFVLNVPEGARTLVLTYIGFVTQEITLRDGQTSVNVVLKEDVKALDEVVVVGYGTQKKVNVTGAVAAVTFDDKLTSRALSNVSTALQGLLPGLAVNQSSGMAGNNSATLMIRGLGTVNGTSGPLVVVDGMPDVDLNRLNMQDIESISVLKDAASSSIYGSRAANGVILVTTKSGKGKKPSLTVSSHLAVQRPTNSLGFMADYPRSLLIHRNAQMVRSSGSNLRYREGTIEQWLAMGMVDPFLYPNTDWFDLVIRDGLQQNYNISANGGNDVSSFFISAGVLDERGMQVGNDYKRYNARFNYDYKVRDNINVGVRFNGNWSDYLFAIDQGFTGNSKPNSGYDLRFAIAGITPYDPVTGYYGGAMAYNEAVTAFNPYSIYMNELSNRNQKQANGVFFIDWQPLKGLSARLDYSLNYSDQFTKKADIPNVAYNFQADAPTSRWYVLPNAGIENTTNNNYKTMLTGQLSYKTTIAKDHELSALAVYSEEYWKDRAQFGSRLDRLHPSLSELDAALGGTNQVATGSSQEEGLRSVIARFNYNAFDKYLLELNFRYDGSSRFLPGHQYGFFPSASFGWRFTEENFLSTLKDIGINSGKLRMSYGGLGNNNVVGRYEQRETLVANNYMIDDAITRGFVYKKMVNSDFSWEKTNVFNIGLDITFLKNRLSAELDYYDRLTVDMARPSDISVHISGAYDAPRQNIGEMRNRGVEGNFTWKAGSRDFKYSINLNASYNKNRLEKWNELLVRGNVFLDMPYRFLYTYVDKGVAQTWQDVYNATPQGASPGDILRLDLNGDGMINDNDRKPYDNYQLDRPHTNFALNSSFAYKGFDLNVQLQGAAGRKDYWINYHNELEIGERYATVWDHWTEPWSVENRDGSWPRLNGSTSNRLETTFWLDDLSYLRIRNVQLGYTLPRNLLSRIGVNNARIFVSGENLHTFTSYRGTDPESTASKNDVYPLAKSFSLGLNVNF